MKKKDNKRKKDTSKEEVAHLKDNLARALADYDNLVKRVDKERETLGVVIKTQFLKRLLPAFDMLYNAQGHLRDAGLAMTIQSFEQTLQDEGFVKVDAEVGQDFDEEYHEAVELVQDDAHKGGKIVEVVLVGWKRTDGTLVRPAKVKVAKQK